MSLAIEVADVEAVLLPNGVWHLVAEHSFEVDAYWFQHNRVPRLIGGEGAPGGNGGATWRADDGSRFFCAVEHIVAVRMAPGK